MSLKGEAERKDQKKAVREPWISKETWRLGYQRSALLWAGRASSREVCKARRDFQCALQEDRWQGQRSAGKNKESLMVDGRVKEEWDHLARCYCRAWINQVHPTRESLDQESEVIAELYRCRPPARLKVPILVQPMEVNAEVPTE